MNRFFVSKSNISDNQTIITIDDTEDIKHLIKVLRISVGNEIEVCDGNNTEYRAIIKEISKERVLCEVLSAESSARESNIELVLFQGLPKSNKMDLIIQKAVEIGVRKIVPLITERTIVKINDKKSENKKISRWQKIALEAAKQCKRGVIPEVTNVIDFNNLEDKIKSLDLMIIPYELENNIGIKRILQPASNINRIGIVIGPEGGFEEDEINKVLDWGAKSVSLGPRILRTETAGIVASSIVMYELGDLGGK